MAVADEKINLIKTYISKSETAIENLTKNQNKIKELSKLLTELEKIRLTLDEINNSINKANTQKVELDKSIENAATTRSNLDGSIANAESTNTTLKATDTEAKKTEISIKDLMSQLGKTENEVKQIIASGDLSKYVTDPKLQEALKSYATKEDLQGIDVTGQLADYAKKTDLNNKVEKVNGKALSTNDFTDIFKNQLSNFSVISSDVDADGVYKTVEYKGKTGLLVFKTELLGESPYEQIKLTAYSNGVVKETQVWNLKYDENEFIYRKELQ